MRKMTIIKEKLQVQGRKTKKALNSQNFEELGLLFFFSIYNK